MSSMHTADVSTRSNAIDSQQLPAEACRVSQPPLSPLGSHIPPQYPHQPPCTLQTDVQTVGAVAVADVDPGVVVVWVLVAHQGEFGGGGVMVDGASLIGGAL